VSLKECVRGCDPNISLTKDSTVFFLLSGYYFR